jgi:hypothetical protein
VQELEEKSLKEVLQLVDLYHQDSKGKTDILE